MVTWPRVEINAEKDIDMCFVCGQDNPVGLKLNFSWDGKTASAEFTPNKFHQGWSGVVHGGIIHCLLDEAVSYAAYLRGITCLTAKVQVRLKRVTAIGEPLIITSSIIKQTRKVIEAKATVCLKDGTLVAESIATMFVFDSKGEKPESNV